MRLSRVRPFGWLIASVALPGFFLLSGCSGDGVGLTAAGDPQTNRSAEVVALFATHCIRCHAPGGSGYIQTGGAANHGLDLTAAGYEASLINRQTFELPDVSPRWRLLPGEPDSSYVVEKIMQASPKFGLRMPMDGPPYLSSTDMELVRSWIEDGAVSR